MSSICGIHRWNGMHVERSEIETMLNALEHWAADARSTWLQTNVGLGHLLLWTTPESRHDNSPLHDEANNLAVTGDLRLDNRAELISELGMAAAPEELPDSRLVLHAYRAWGTDCVAHLDGDFAFALWDGRRGQLLCARDRFGVKPFYYSMRSGEFAFATEMKGLLALDRVDRSINEHWVADFLHGLMLDGDTTLYNGIRRLEPASSMTVGTHGARTWRYWRLDPEREVRFAREQDYVDAFEEKLVRAVQRRLRTPFIVGAELSGGLDSAGICGIAGPLLKREGRELHTFSQVRPVHTDEVLPDDAQDAVRLLCEHAGITHTCLLTGVDEGITTALDWAHRHYDEPPRLVVALFNDQLYEAARASHVRVLLSGFGGNQGVSAISSGVRQELLRSLRWKALWRELNGNRNALGTTRAFARLLFDQLTPTLPTALLPAAKRAAFWQKFPYRPLRDDVARRTNVRERAHAFATRFHGARTLRQQVAQMLGGADVALRLESGNIATAARKLEYRYPLLDTELVEFFLAVPPGLKHRGGVGRYLFRRSLEAWVPDSVRWNLNARASANPGAVLRKRKDRAELTARLQGLPADHPVFAYVDLTKLMARPAISGRRARQGWERDTELLNVLLLERKLRDAMA